MFQDNPLLAQLKQQLQKDTPRIQGTVKSSGKGFGFIEVDGQSEHYFIPPPSMKKVMHGDCVTARLRTEKGQTVAEPEALVEAALTRFVGRIERKSSQLIVVPDHPLLKMPITCHANSEFMAMLKEGDWIRAILQRHPLEGKGGFRAEMCEWIAHGDDNFAPWRVTLARHQLARTATASETDYVLSADGLVRRDLTALPFVTIDAATTQDMDDALAISRNAADHWVLSVAIADPTAYVAVGSPLDQTARQRGFTHYLPGLNIPMLPRDLSENLCALQAGERRPAIVCQVIIDQQGRVVAPATFVAAWIISIAKLTYDQVSDWLEGCGDWQPEHPEMAEQIQWLHQLATARTHWRQQHATVFKDRPEHRFVLSEQWEVVDVVLETRRTAHRLVEEAMITANLCFAALLRDRLGYGIFSVHAGLESAQIDQVVSLLQANNAPFSGERLLTVAGFSELRRYLDAQPTPYLSGCLRRYQAMAGLSCRPAAHFGMGVEVYATWTSPIRKYGDLVNHRLLKAVLAEREPEQQPDPLLTDHLNECRRQHRLAERQVSDWLYARFLQHCADGRTRIEAEIIDVTRGGLRVRLLNNGAAVFLPGSLLHPAREKVSYCQESASITIKGGTTYRLGDRLAVVLREVLLETRNIIASPAA